MSDAVWQEEEKAEEEKEMVSTEGLSLFEIEKRNLTRLHEKQMHELERGHRDQHTELKDIHGVFPREDVCINDQCDTVHLWDSRFCRMCGLPSTTTFGAAYPGRQ